MHEKLQIWIISPLYSTQCHHCYSFIFSVLSLSTVCNRNDRRYHWVTSTMTYFKFVISGARWLVSAHGSHILFPDRITITVSYSYRYLSKLVLEAIKACEAIFWQAAVTLLPDKGGYVTTETTSHLWQRGWDSLEVPLASKIPKLWKGIYISIIKSFLDY